NNPTLTEFCFGTIGRADIKGSKSNVAMNAWLPQVSDLARSGYGGIRVKTLHYCSSMLMLTLAAISPHINLSGFHDVAQDASLIRKIN
ncbi:hypothetical protein M422DRAFT_187681, partial [Sphaerobolus stellatus SS14]